MGVRPVTKQTDRERAQSLHDLAVALGATCPCQRSDNALTLASTTLERFNPNHYGPGDKGGQFAPKDEGANSSSTSAPPKPVRVASNDGGVRTDAAPQNPEQIAGGGESNEEGGRGRGPIEDEFDLTAPIRQEFYNAARDKLRAIDPSNPAIPSLHSPDWVPSKEDANAMQEALNRAIEDRAAEAAEHSYKEHVEVRKEFPEIHSQTELQLLAQDVMSKETPRTAPNGHIIFYRSSTKYSRHRKSR